MATTPGSAILRAGRADVARARARTWRRRVFRLVLVFVVVDAYLWYRYASHQYLSPSFPDWLTPYLPALVLVVLLGSVMVLPVIAMARSPHVMIRPEDIEVGLSDLRGLDPQVQEVERTLDVFLGYATFRDELGGNPRRGILFEGPPGTGKTYMAKAMAKQAGVPFLFVSSPAFRSAFHGMTATKIRAFFRALRRAARKEGGAIGFIEEIDAVGMARGGLNMTPAPKMGALAVSNMVAGGDGGTVNELLIQMQSFDQPAAMKRFAYGFVQRVNGYLPERHRIKTKPSAYSNIMVIAATNRADDLDPALLRPGRFDRRLYFDLPTKQGRRDLIDFFLGRKAHHEQLADDAVRERLAHDTLGYTPVMIEHLFDEALLVALRGGRRQMNLEDIYEARITEEVGLRQPVAYTEEERRAVATHEAGHATVAYFLGIGRRLEVLSIIKRSKSLGMLAHGDIEERWTRSKTELEAAVAIALGGLVSEETFLGQSGTGPANDLAHATEVAVTMVGALGMAGSLISYEALSAGPINSANLVGKVLGDPEGKRRVEDILDTQKERVAALLDENADIVMALRDALIARDELVGESITEVIEQALVARSTTTAQ
ncbi:MAG TPA: AAA family ATPase [Actinomycetota bacterium]|nr:AAA family ATPase [Actinomycetota bacterium]